MQSNPTDWHAVQQALNLNLNLNLNLSLNLSPNQPAHDPDYAQLHAGLGRDGNGDGDGDGRFLAAWQDPQSKWTHPLLIPFLIVHFCPSPDTHLAGGVKITNNAALPRAIRSDCMHWRTLMAVHGLFLSHAMGPLCTPKLLEYASRFTNTTAATAPDKWLIVQATLVLTCTLDQPHTLPAFPANTTMTDLAITLTLIHALYHLPIPPHLPTTHPQLAATLFPILVLTYPYRLIDPLTSDWLLAAYRANRSVVRPVVRAAMLSLGAVAPSAAWHVAQYLRSAAMLPALTIELAVRFAPAANEEDGHEDASVVVDLADAVLSANPRAVARDLVDSAADPVDLAAVPSEPAAQVLALFLTRRLLSRRLGHVEQLTHVRLLALLAGMIPNLVSFSDLQSINAALLDDNRPKKQQQLSTYLACLAFATLTSPASTTQALATNSDGDDLHWTRASLASYTCRLPPLATLLHLATSPSATSSSSSGPSGWAAAEHAWCTWLHISPALPGLLGGTAMAGDRLLRWTSWVTGELAARDAVVGAGPLRGAQVELMVALIRERRVAGPAASTWVLEHLLAMDLAVSAADVELVEVFVDAGVMTGACPPLDHAAVQAHVAASSLSAAAVRTLMPVSSVLLTYYVLMLTTRLGPWAHSAHFPVEVVHTLPVPRALARARGTPVEYKLRASLGVVGEYLALMQAVDCSGFVDDDGGDHGEAGEEGDDEAESVQTLIARGRVGQWTRKFALDPIQVAHATLATLCPAGVPSWPDLLANPMSLFSTAPQATNMFATTALANMSLLTLDFLLASSASLVRSRALRAFGTYIDAQQHEHDAAKLEWQVGEAVAGVKAGVMNAVAECVLLGAGGTRGGGADGVLLGWMNRMYMKDGLLVGRCVGLGVDPRTVPRLVKLTSFHVFIQQFTSTLPTHPHLTLYLLAALCYEYPLPETLQLATKHILPMLPAMFSSSLDAGQLGVPMGSDVHAAAPRMTRFDVVRKAVVEVVRAFPEDLGGGVQTILLETKKALTQRLMHQPDANLRAVLIQYYDGLMETVKDVMLVVRKGVVHCGR